MKAKCLTEIQNVCMSNGQLDISSENIKRLTYLEACIKETLRLRTLFNKLNGFAVKIPDSNEWKDFR